MGLACVEERGEARGRGVAVEVEEVAVGARALPRDPGHARRGAAHLVHLKGGLSEG